MPPPDTKNGLIPLSSIVSFRYISEEHGNGAVFENQLCDPHAYFSDSPLYSYLHYFTRKSCMTCECCYKVLGSLANNINHVLKIANTTLSIKASNTLEKLGSHYPELQGHSYIQCSQVCGAIYCNDSCLNKHKTSHSVHCNLFTPGEHEQWLALQRHALKHHENFYFTGEVYLDIIASALLEKADITTTLNRLFEYFYDRNWYETDEGVDDEKFKIMAESYDLMTAALDRFKEMLLRGGYNGVEQLLSLETFSRLLRTMDLVCVDIEFTNPWNDILNRIYQSSGDEIEFLETELRKVYSILYGVEYESSQSASIFECAIFPDVIGLGIYAVLSKLNHCCDPNLEIEYDGKKEAVVVLKRCVGKGEEATISYIDETCDFEARQFALLERYGFVCNCVKCTKES